jgi:Uma2 family endonuclease
MHDAGQQGAPAASPYPRMSYEEYLDDSTIDGHAEWVDGEVVPMMSVSRAHAQLSGCLFRLIGNYVEARRLGEVFYEPFQMKLSTGRAPDIIFVATDHADQIKDKHLEGPADLVIEIISPGTETVDRGDKFLEYESGGVPEYWILDPFREIAEFYVRDDAGIFRAARVSPDGVYESPALAGLRLKVDWSWERPPVGRLLDQLDAAR